MGSMLEEEDDIIYKPFCTFLPALICPRDHPLAEKRDLNLSDISPYGLILPPRHLSTWRIVDLVFGQHGAEYQVALEAGGWEVIKKYVELGLRHLHRHRCLPDGRRKPGRPPPGQVFPETQLRYCAEARTFSQSPDSAIHRHGQRVWQRRSGQHAGQRSCNIELSYPHNADF